MRPPLRQDIDGIDGVGMFYSPRGTESGRHLALLRQTTLAPQESAVSAEDLTEALERDPDPWMW